MSKNVRFAIKTITFCAIFIALAVIMARFLAVAPSESVRFSFESVPIFLSGVLFGPIAGAMVGFCSDFLGCLFSPYGFNPLLSFPPVLYGIFGGIFQCFLAKKVSFFRILLSLLPPVVLGSILVQSFVLNYLYGSGFLVLLSARSIQFAVVLVLDALLIRILFKSKVLGTARLWPPAPRKKEGLA